MNPNTKPEYLLAVLTGLAVVACDKSEEPKAEPAASAQAAAKAAVSAKEVTPAGSASAGGKEKKCSPGGCAPGKCG